ncbi:ABC transporter thiamine pyrophosphate-binding lipoprotein p37/Cypl [Metamycoplasma spumans]|uniref:ABC transporter thiamine pyrophosphate-binding lipoprotein p37/Cypl n=1 Tax=Metamycoplasma spumans TaxID=92406 RepID=UPI0034DD9996
MSKFRHLTVATVFLATSAGLVAASCSHKSEQTITFSVNKPWYGENKTGFFEKIEDNYNKNEQNNTKIKITTEFIGENNDLATSLLKGKSDVAILTSTLFNLGDNPKKITPIIQTMTKQFVFDKQASFYENGSENDPLRLVADQAYALFAEKPYKQWTNESYGWNGSIYTKFYEKGEAFTDYYRGLIMIQGTDEELNNITKAWNDKDWNAFRNFGIVTGSKDSGSKYHVQEALFKKHFNKEGNKFESFELDKLANSNKYIEGKARDIGRGALAKYHIVFDELGSFAYTKNNKKGKVIDYYTPENAEAKIKFLTATDPIKYNVFATSKYLDKNIANGLAKSIYETWKEGQDDYGQTVGFFAYKIINDPQKEVIDPYHKTFGI